MRLSDFKNLAGRYYNAYWNSKDRSAKAFFLFFLDFIELMKIAGLFYGSGLLSKLKKRLLSRNPERAGTPKKRNLLILSYYSPPYRSLFGTQRLANFIKYLHRENWDITLITTEPASEAECDRDSDALPEGITVIRLKPAKLKSFIENRRLAVPDDFIYWILPAVKAVKKRIKDKSPSVLFCTAPPYSNLLAGTICSGLFDIPLVSDFRDPWSQIDFAWKLSDPILGYLSAGLEVQVLRRSAKIIIADDIRYTHDYFSKPGPPSMDKVISIRNGFDDEDFEGQKKDGSKEKFRVVYAGTLYNKTNFQNIIKPFEIWKKKHPGDFKDVLFEYAGHNPGYFNEQKNLPFEWINHGYVSHREAIALRFKASLQLFALDRSFKPHMLSGKIYEIIRTGIPVLALVDPGGAVADLIRETGAGIVADSEDWEGSAALLKDFYEKWHTGNLSVKMDPEAIYKFSRAYQARQLSEVLDGVINGAIEREWPF